MKNVRNKIVLKDKENSLGLKCNETCREDECINKPFGLAIRKDELD